MTSLLRHALTMPEKREITDLDNPDTTLLHARILKKNTFLRKLYTDIYTSFRASLPDPTRSRVLEIGSGGGFIKDIIPHAMTGDILPLPGLDIQLSAHDIPLQDSSLDAICMINTLHHVPSVEAFFNECTRCLKPGGHIIMTEPSNTFISRFINTRFHHEAFDTAASWDIPPGGPLSSGNQALPWIIFCRDRDRFEQQFPALRIRRIINHTPLRYIISGGFTARQFLPGWMYTPVKIIEWLLHPLHNMMGMSMGIEIEKAHA